MSLHKIPLPDWDKLSFSFRATDVMYQSLGDGRREPLWDDGRFLPFGAVQLSPSAAISSYGVGVFEGLKARRAQDGRVLLFRAPDHAQRFQRSAQALLMAPFPNEQFVAAVEETVSRNLRFLPPHGKGSFYVRPVQHAIEPKLGAAPSSQFWVLVFGAPVGNFFREHNGSSALHRLRLKVLEQGRCAPGGIGSAKAVGNYAAGLTMAHPWKQKGFDEVLYLDARHVRYVTETSGSNFFVLLKNGILVTPGLDDQILAGITRDSVLRVARDVLGISTEERLISIHEVLSEAQEIFCTGTAWTVRSVRELVVRNIPYRFQGRELHETLLGELKGIQRGEKPDPFGWIREVRNGD